MEYTECKYGGPLGRRPGRVMKVRLVRPSVFMADHSVVARDESSEASEASVFCFDNASPEKSCFVDGQASLFYFAMPRRV